MALLTSAKPTIVWISVCSWPRIAAALCRSGVVPSTASASTTSPSGEASEASELQAAAIISAQAAVGMSCRPSTRLSPRKAS